ncbi:MAG: two pore domain potassium channel family protein, partial [Spirochaetaceae bacterium]
MQRFERKQRTFGPANSLSRQTAIAGLIVLIVIAAGVTGYSLIEGWSLADAFYMTIITITTTGFHEVHPLSESGRI